MNSKDIILGLKILSETWAVIPGKWETRGQTGENLSFFSYLTCSSQEVWGISTSSQESLRYSKRRTAAKNWDALQNSPRIEYLVM